MLLNTENSLKKYVIWLFTSLPLHASQMKLKFYKMTTPNGSYPSPLRCLWSPMISMVPQHESNGSLCGVFWSPITKMSLLHCHLASTFLLWLVPQRSSAVLKHQRLCVKKAIVLSPQDAFMAISFSAGKN